MPGWGSAVLVFRFIVVVVLLVVSFERCTAGQPSTRINLSAPHLVESFLGVVFVFEENNLDCPEDRSTVAVSKGMLKVFSLRFPPFESPVFLTKIKADPVDDTTYRYQLAKAACRMDIDIRHQVKNGDQWKSLLVMQERRPSLSAEARLEAAKKGVADLMKKAEVWAKKNPMSIAEIVELLRAKGPGRWNGSTISMGFPFDDAPKPCMDVLGEYRMTRNSFAVAFFAPLPGELNKFVLEGFDLDGSHARIYLTKDDCRFEFTISQSVMHDSRWTTLPLRPVPKDREAKEVEPRH
jgi:hypothetical protein